MPVNKNAMTRYQILDGLLSNRYHCYTIDDLMDEVNEQLADMGIAPVGRRCIEKDLKYLELESNFFADIECYTVPNENGKRPKNCYRYAKRSYSIFKKEMSDDEQYLLSEALSMLGQFEGLPNLAELERLQSGFTAKNKRRIVSFSKNPLENKSIFGELFTAITQKMVVQLSYHTFAEPEQERSIVLHPYLLKEYNRRWYLFGMAENDKKTLCFALDRVNSIKAMPQIKFIKYDGQVDEWFDDIVGVTRYEDRQAERILFWVSDKSKDYVATKPLHDSQRHYKNDAEYRAQYPQLQGGAFFSIDCIENYELIRELMSFNEELIVLTPEHIQDKIMERARAVMTNYQKVRT